MAQLPRLWTRVYWDIFDHLYWTPSYLGLKSVTQSNWMREGDKICIPAEMSHPKGPLYYRHQDRNIALENAQRFEEPFNHLLDLTLSLLSDEDLAAFLSSLCDLPDLDRLRCSGRELSDELQWHENTTRPDVLARGEGQLVMVEIKFGAKTSLDQIAKYMAVAVRDAQLNGEKALTSLTYIVPGDNPIDQIEKAIGMTLSDFKQIDLNTLCEGRNSTIAEILLRDQELTRRVLRDTHIKSVSWNKLHSVCLAQARDVPDDRFGRTYRNLMLGLAEAVKIHPLSKVP